MPSNIITAVLGLAVNSNCQYLLTKRHEPKNPQIHGKWQVPGGGMEFGETVEQTLAREMEEELKVHVRILYPFPIIKTHTYDFNSQKAHLVLIVYLVSLGQQKPEIADPEASELGWFTSFKAQKLDILPHTDYYLMQADKIIKKEKILI